MEDGPTATGGYHLTPAELHDRGQATLEWIVREVVGNGSA